MEKGVIPMSKKNQSLKKNYMPALPNPHYEPLIEIYSDREAVIEGCAGILEYNDSCVSVNCRCFVLNFKGFNFCIKSNSKDSITIYGKITEINFSHL